MQYIAQKYSQGDQEYLSLVMDLKTIYKNSQALIYGVDEFGYQRPLDISHSNKIKNKVLGIEKDILFPTSIILGLDEDESTNIITNVSNFADQLSSSVVYFNLPENITYKVFRIIDGQHRIAGLSAAAEQNPELWNLPLNIIILLMSKEKRINELNVFKDINSTAKKLKTDLVILAKQQYILLGQEDLKNKNDMESYVATKTSFILNEEISGSVWENAIKFEKEINSQLGVIGVSAFNKAIMPLVRERVKDFNLYEINISSLDEVADGLARYINTAWSLVFDKWKDCFGNYNVILDSDEYQYRYNSSFYLQKTTGVNAISQILYQQNEKNNPLECFKAIIDKSPLTSKDWIKGGKLAGLTSGSGFKKAVNLIQVGDKNKFE
ncbi:DGQHR domain-containing protein [Sporosarcina beigongshangi]|uniref:DGQHR domain-containing protein n=1 Tax=Sporosarcina beigongshangi TaxID=2782538 RepID=UPI0019398897|nr:DGQHR domain-containing protein [Sporosarcina beigongshangi]